jgi:hypothetical protein
MAALAYHRATGRRAAQPNQRLGYGENFLYMLDAGGQSSYKPNPKLARAVEVLFILHAEHEMNCSTAAVRCTHCLTITASVRQPTIGPCYESNSSRSAPYTFRLLPASIPLAPTPLDMLNPT